MLVEIAQRLNAPTFQTRAQPRSFNERVCSLGGFRIPR